MYNNPDSFDNADLSDVILGKNRYVPIMHQFIYLGTIISSDGTDRKDVVGRIKKASSAFGALKRTVFGTNYVCDVAKGKAYISIVLPIPLFGSEC